MPQWQCTGLQVNKLRDQSLILGTTRTESYAISPQPSVITVQNCGPKLQSSVLL